MYAEDNAHIMTETEVEEDGRTVVYVRCKCGGSFKYEKVEHV